MVFGPRRTPLPPERAIPNGGEETLREVLEDIVAQGLSEPPCLVAFSGGRDSSALLALAAHVARTRGLPDPIPVTYRFGDHVRADETEWQELVVRHLGLRDWTFVREAHVRLDALGEIAQRLLLRHGLYWPPNAHSFLPLLEAASGATLITGKGGDEVFSPVAPRHRFHWRTVRRMPLRRGVQYTLQAFLPTALSLRLKYRGHLRFPWLRPEARHTLRKRFFAQFHAPQPNVHSLVRFNDTRYLELYLGMTRVLAKEARVAVVEPFIHPRFLAAWIRRVRPEAYRGRGAALDALFGDLLPKAIVRRSSKALFTEVFWGPECRRFSARWDGGGLDPAYVDPDALRREWGKNPPDARAFMPLQAAWLASAEGRDSGSFPS